MPELGGTAFLVVGVALLLGHAAHVIGARAHVPRVTILLLIGLACGPSALDVVPRAATGWFPFVTQLTLALVGFMLGEEFVHKRARHSRRVLIMTLLVTLITAACVTLAVLAVGGPVELALVLGGVATATDPVATMDVVRESRARGPLSDEVMGIVAADDVLGVLLFSGLMALAEGFADASPEHSVWLHGLWEIGGAAAVGVAFGLPMAWLTGRLRPGEPALLEALGFILLVLGVTTWLEVSFLLACMVLGGTLAFRARHHTRAVHEIEGISGPVLTVFFLFAGIGLDVDALPGIGLLGAVYVVARIGGRIFASWVGAHFVSASAGHGLSLGLCLLPQAGVALGLSLLAAQRLPAIADTLMTLSVSATVLFELIGPVATRWRLAAAGETDHARGGT